MTQKYVGAHVSTEGGVANAPQNAHDIGAKAFALFTKNPSRWKGKAISDKEAKKFKDDCIKFGYSPEIILPHDSFLINLGAPDAEKLSLSREAFLDEMKRCEKLGLKMLNFHPGSHLNQMEAEKCLDLIAESINLTLQQTQGVKAVIENTAGQGSNLGFQFEHLRHIIDRVTDKQRIGVCIDTCHLFASGYGLLTPEEYEKTWQEFDKVVGLDYLCGMHLNDSKKGQGSRVDRHESLGKGTLGPDFFKMLMNDPRFNGIPMVLETPDESLWPQEIAWLYSLVENSDGQT